MTTRPAATRRASNWRAAADIGARRSATSDQKRIGMASSWSTMFAQNPAALAPPRVRQSSK
jgi:hypothetical protein